VIGFLKGTIDKRRMIGAALLTEILTFIDQAYTLYQNKIVK